MASALKSTEFRLAEETRKLAANWLPAKQPLPVDRQPNRLRSSKLASGETVKLMKPKPVSAVKNGAVANVFIGPAISLQGNGLLADIEVSGSYFGIVVDGFVVVRCVGRGSFGNGITGREVDRIGLDCDRKLYRWDLGH